MVLLYEKQTVAAVIQTADRAADTVDGHALGHALSAASSVQHYAAVHAVLAAAAPKFSQHSAVFLLNYYVLS